MERKQRVGGETPGEGFPSFWLCQKFTLVIRKNRRTMPVKQGMAYAKNLPLASSLNAAALTAVSDQGLCP